MRFETTFNSIIAAEVIIGYKIDSYDKFMEFIDELMVNASSMEFKESVRKHLQDEIKGFPDVMKKYDDIYIFMDRLSLSQIIAIYRCCDKHIHNKIFSGLINANMTFGYSSPGTFEDFLRRIVPIRNCISHFNSLEILINYYNIKSKELRSYPDRKRYKKVIARLST